MSSEQAEATPPAAVPAEQPAANPAAPQVKERPPLTSIKDIGISADKNARFRRTMEDTHTFQDGFLGVPTSGYFGIYDGHGGKDAAEYVKEHLHVNLAKKLETNEDKQKAFVEAYLETDESLDTANIKYSGTTAVSALIVEENGKKVLYTANVGDARIVLGRAGKGIRLTYDHKASDQSEIDRIQSTGGFVVMARVNGILAVSRSLGDRAMKPYVSGEPYTTRTELTEEDTHVILACDGVWDVISDDQSVEIVSKHEKMQVASKELLKESLLAGSTDNISVMVLKL